MKQTKDRPQLLTALEKRGRWLDEYRGWAFWVIGGLYLLGYTGWSIYSFKENLGPLPALDSQYLVTGVAVAVVFIISYVVYQWLRIIPRRIEHAIRRSPYSNNYIRWLRRFFVASAIIVVPYFGTLLYHIWIGFQSPPYLIELPKWFLATQDYFFVLMLMSVFLAWILHIAFGRRETATPVGFMYNLPLLFCTIGGVVLLCYVITTVLPIIPQSLGGFRPRCAYLSMEDAGYERELLPRLIHEISEEPPFVTKRLDVLYSNDSILLVRPNNDSTSMWTYEVRKDTVSLIEWCTGPRTALR